MNNSLHHKWLLEGVEKWNARRIKDDFYPELSFADLRMDLKVDFGGLDLMNINLARANLMGANLREADLSEANLFGANLQNTILIGANFIKANLKNADLSGANLVDTNLMGANLTGVKVLSKKFYQQENRNRLNTDLSYAIGLTQEQVNSMIGDINTILPTGLHPPQHWERLDKKEKSLNKLVRTISNNLKCLKSKKTKASFDKPVINILQTPLSSPIDPPKIEESRNMGHHSLLRRGLFRVVSVLGASIVAITIGITINILTSDNAVTTLQSRLKQVLEVTLELF